MSLWLRAAIALALAFLLTAGFCAYMHIYRSGYPISPLQFKAQAARIAHGMSQDQVFDVVTVYTRCEWTDHRRVEFAMEPKAGGRLFRATCRIYVEFDSNGRVAAVETHHG